MHIPFPVELEARWATNMERLDRIVATIEKSGVDDPVLPAFWTWLRNGRLSYRMEHDLLEALLLSDLPDDIVLALPHELMWIDLEGQTELHALGEPIAGFFFGAGKDGEWCGVASTRVLGDRSTNSLWFHAAADEVRDRGLSYDDRATVAQLRHIALMVTFYLMDPAHEESPETLHGNAPWARRLKDSGAKDPARVLLLARHRVLGAAYRLPAHAYEATGRGLGLRTPVRGHVRMQKVGRGRESVRATWVQPHWRGPPDGPSAAIVADVQQPLKPSLSDEERRRRLIEATRR